jgi:plasmid stabilization system protein ParE
MAAVVYSARALRHLSRIFETLAETDPAKALAAARAIRSVIELLSEHPLIGRLVRQELRELVISHGRTGYLALYRYRPLKKRVEVLAIKHQRELDYRP